MFVRINAVLCLLAASLPGVTFAADSARTVVQRSLAAVSAGRDIRTIKSIRTSTHTVTFDIQQNDHTGAPYYTAFEQAIMTDDLAGHRSLAEVVLAPTTNGPERRRVVLRTREVMQTKRIGGSAPQDPIVDLPPPSWELENPLRALLLADAAADLEREPDAMLHEALQQVVRFRHGTNGVRLFIDAATGLPSATEMTFALHHVSADDVAWNPWGDIVDRTEFMNWYTVEGIRYPSQSDTSRNGERYRATTVSEAHLDVALDPTAFTPPPAAVARAADLRRQDIDELPLGGAVPYAPDPKLPIAEIAPGIVQIPGSWYATVIRQPDGIVVIDAPISAGYSRQVLDEARRRFPGLPIKALVTSTSFFWHIAGVREYAARGIPIYVRDRNVAIVRAMLAAPHKLFPDDLARQPQVRPEIRAVSQRTQIGTGANALVLFPILQATQPMLMTYVADARLIHTGEMVQPLGPGGALLYPESLLEIAYAVRDARIDATRMIGMHMSPTPWSRIAEALRAAGIATGDGGSRRSSH